MKTDRIIVGISGASGAPLAIELLKALKQTKFETHLIVTPGGWRTISEETDFSPEDVCALEVLREQIGHHEREHVDEHEAHHGREGRVPEGVLEARIGERRLVVGEPGEAGVGGDAERAEGEVDALDERPYEANGERGDHRAQEEPRPASGGSPEGVVTGRLAHLSPFL